MDVRKPQGLRTEGGKQVRLQHMGARFQRKQCVVPGVVSGREVVIDPKWTPFVNQWRTFPAGHDDILDAAYWATLEAFTVPLGAGAMLEKPVPPVVTKEDQELGEIHPFVGRRRTLGRPIGSRRRRVDRLAQGLLFQ